MPKTYTHDPVTPREAQAIEELGVIDALAVGLTVARLRAADAQLDVGWLDRLTAFIANRRSGLMTGAKGAGALYAPTPAGVRPVYVRAKRAGRRG